MKGLIQSFRLLHISYVLLKHGLDEIVFATHLFRPLRFLILVSPARWSGRHRKPRGIRIREALEELGPIFVKFGQVLSTRPDMVPEDIVKELRKLQDQVPPFNGEIAKSMIEKALEHPVHHFFQVFETKALASASIAQVHAGELLTGEKVVVKVLRPQVEKRIKRDVALLKTVANLANRYWRVAKQFKPKEIVREFEVALKDELDLMREAANASQLRRNFLNAKELYIPKIHWPLTRNNILVMERINGIPIYHIEELQNAGFNLKQLAEQGVDIFFTQVFRDCFFHADMHPGNIFINRTIEGQPQFIAVDFGIMGSLGPKDQRYLAENFLAFFNRNYRRVAELHVESGWLPPNTRVDEFEAAIRTVSEPIFELPLKEISFATLLLRLFQTATRFKVEIQPQLILLQKTLLSVEGLGRQLYPELDLWTTAKPYLEKWMKTEMGPKAFFDKCRLYGPYWLEKLPEIPNLVYNLLQQKVDEKRLVHPKIPTVSQFSKMAVFFGMLLGMSALLLFIFAWRFFQ